MMPDANACRLHNGSTSAAAVFLLDSSSKGGWSQLVEVKKYDLNRLIRCRMRVRLFMHNFGLSEELKHQEKTNTDTERMCKLHTFRQGPKNPVYPDYNHLIQKSE